MMIFMVKMLLRLDSVVLVKYMVNMFNIYTLCPSGPWLGSLHSTHLPYNCNSVAILLHNSFSRFGSFYNGSFSTFLHMKLCYPTLNLLLKASVLF